MCLTEGILSRNSPADQWMHMRDPIMGIRVTAEDPQSSYLNHCYEWLMGARELLALGTGVNLWVGCGILGVEICVWGLLGRCSAADL